MCEMFLSLAQLIHEDEPRWTEFEFTLSLLILFGMNFVQMKMSRILYLNWQLSDQHLYRHIPKRAWQRGQTGVDKRLGPGCWFPIKYGRQAGQAGRTLLCLTWERRPAGGGALCRGGSGGRVLVISHLLPYLYKQAQKETRWGRED